MKRREFLKLTGATLAAATLTCGGLTIAATRKPQIDLPEETLGGNNPMNKKILVTYATRAGSTAEIAEKIGETLAAQGAVVDVLPVQQVTGLQDYQAVVIGSGIRYSTWLPEAVKFLEQNREALSGKPAAFFVVYLMNMGDDETSRRNRQAYLDSARNLVAPKAEAFFTGVGDMSKVSFLERMIGKAVKSPEGDFRDWQAITAWAERLQGIL